ncbi:Crp/Fnr family transcriptional regulator [Chryseobacterium turcicum]|uniref:Crp/Fnr family transcriptional regulator n=1 Tax=Chryseobacterium turcicum TaxID=2898076 RepID=A0A9Q3V222_9FLAO|nr:Crp/Fnr family transcriptional regulator [Chryseobacterium turcicum]MCD1118158.1 Crp/Fnr family transcriptional regulator [Chryseobacterium turcicum]
MDIIKTLLDKYKVQFSQESMSKFESILVKKEYHKDEMVLQEGTISRYLYIVEKGMVRQFYYKDGRDITEHFSCEGNIATCIESLFLQQPTRLLIEALEPSTLFLLDYDKWKKLCDEFPEINELYRAVMEYKLVVSQQKADSWRFENSRERYDRFCRELPSVSRRASVAHIASYLLMSPETLSRVRAGVL